MTSRLASLRARIEEAGLTALLVATRENVLYLSGFSGSAGALIITPHEALLLTDFRYVLQVQTEAPAWTLVQVEATVIATVRETLLRLGFDHVGIDPQTMTLATYEQLTADVSYTTVPAAGLVEGLRLVKDPAELVATREAVRITDGAYSHLLTLARPGVTERDLALEAEWYMRRHGASAVAFDLIIAAGPHSALPHAQPGDRPLQPGDLVVVDMGARYAHYCSDMTRTFAVSEATPEAEVIYRICAEAQCAGVAGIHAGMTGREADAVVRQVIIDAGYGDYFGHGTGHGVGLEIHESPRLNTRAEEILPAGTLVTIEPGIYLPEIGGVRIEDLVLVTERGTDVLTGSVKPRTLPIVG